MNDFRVYVDPEAVAQAATDYLYQQIKNCVTEKGKCSVVLPGGSTPSRCLQMLSEKSLPWQNIQWYVGDERCYPLGHAERNDTMILDKLFNQQKHVTENFYPISAELGPEQGAERYAALIDAAGRIDIAILGMGEDGHTASLFPGNAALADSRSVVPVYHAPKPPAERVSLGLLTLKTAGERIVIATGQGKCEALTKLKQGVELPVGLIGVDVWFVDDAAVSTDRGD